LPYDVLVLPGHGVPFYGLKTRIKQLADHHEERCRLIADACRESAKTSKELARISHRVKRIGAPNQRKLFCENDFLMIRGEPRCRQSVSRIFLDLKPSKAAR
jgi:hypothetical protein